MKLVLGTVATALVRKRDAPELYSEVNPAGLSTVSEALEGAQKRSVPHALSRSLKMCVLRGLPPAGLTDMVRETVTDDKKAAQVVRKLATAIGEQAHKTWAARCQAYAEWEKACGITKVMKERRAKAKRTGARDREADAPPDDTAGNARRKHADPEPRQRERCRECDDYGWVRASAAMQVYDHTNRTQHQQLEAAEATAGGGQ
eukprot:tig00000850_g4795.t1